MSVCTVPVSGTRGDDWSAQHEQALETANALAARIQASPPD